MASLTRVQELFHNVLDKLPDERGRFLDQACGDDAELRAQVEKLLLAHSEAGEFLASPTAGLGDESTGDEQPGAVIGHYKLLQPIGEGGCGSVWLAEQKEPVRRKVALKVIKRGMDTRQVIARFEAERQALAMMDHPNIAKVLDGGETPNGRPYFAMELVRGIPITKFCDQERLDTRSRLELFHKVCHAVQHAHQKGVIHRDLKPSNVLVTLHDGVPVPKVIDFGLAKAIHQPLTEKTMFTRLDQMMGTPEYMAPEQAEMSGLDVDTRADIYSLGVLLYELLTGSQPFGDLTRRGHLEMLRVIREEDPQKPSTRISTLGDRVLEVAKLRHTAPKMLGRLVRGDLDWIAMKTLEKDRTRRYETADALAADINRHLENEPVLAGPPSTAYRIRKYIGRHRVGVLAGAGIATALLVGLWLAVIGFLRATQEARRAEANLSLSLEALDEMYLDVAERLPEKQGRLNDADRQLLENALSFYERFAARNSDTATARRELARAYERAGGIHRTLGHSKQALEAFRSAAALFQVLANESPDDRDHDYDLSRVWIQIGNALLGAARVREALEAYEHCLPLVQRLVEEDPTDWRFRAQLARINSGRALTFRRTGRLDQARESAQRTLEIRNELAIEQPEDAAVQRDLASAHNSLAGYVHDADAETHYRKAIEIRRQILAGGATKSFQDRQGLALAHYSLGYWFWKAKRYEEAELALDQAIGIYKQLVTERPHQPSLRDSLGSCLTQLGTVLQHMGRLDEAEKSHREAVDNLRALVEEFPDTPAYQSWMGGALHNLGRFLCERGRNSEAVTLFERAIKHQKAALSPNPKNPTYREFLHNHEIELAGLLVRSMDPAVRDVPRGGQLAKSALELRPDNAWAWRLLGEAHIASRDYKAATDALEKSIGIYEARTSLDPTARANLGNSLCILGDVLTHTGRLKDAEQACRRGLSLYEGLVKDFPEDPENQEMLGFGLLILARVMSARGQPAKALAEAIATYQRSIDHLKAALKADLHSPGYGRGWLREGYLGLVRILIRAPDPLRDLPRAARLAKSALELFPEDASAWYLLGRAHYRQGQLDKAIAAFKKTAAVDPGHPWVYTRLGDALSDQSRSKEAIAAYRKALRIKPELGANHWNLGLLVGESGNHEEAMVLLAKGYALFDARGRARSGTALRKTALRWASSLLKARDPVGARKVLEAGVAILPEDPLMLNALAWHLVDPAGVPEQWDFAAATPIARKAVKCSKRRDPYVLDTLAVALFRHGDIDEAIAVQKEVLQVLDGGDVGNFKVADARAQLVRFEAARKVRAKKGKSDR